MFNNVQLIQGYINQNEMLLNFIYAVFVNIHINFKAPNTTQHYMFNGFD